MNTVQITFKGDKAALDGYVEVLLGTMAMAGLIVRYDLTKLENGNQATIFADMVLRDPPLGHVGLTDIPLRKDASDGERKYGDDF